MHLATTKFHELLNQESAETARIEQTGSQAFISIKQHNFAANFNLDWFKIY